MRKVITISLLVVLFAVSSHAASVHTLTTLEELDDMDKVSKHNFKSWIVVFVTAENKRAQKAASSLRRISTQPSGELYNLGVVDCSATQSLCERFELPSDPLSPAFPAMFAVYNNYFFFTPIDSIGAFISPRILKDAVKAAASKFAAGGVAGKVVSEKYDPNIDTNRNRGPRMMRGSGTKSREEFHNRGRNQRDEF